KAMKITKIEEQKKNKRRLSVFIDGEFSFGADNFTILSQHLKEGDEITKEALSHIKNTAVFEDAKNYAARLISAKSYTVKAMKEKLKNHIGDEEITEKTIDFLKEYKLLDDADFAHRYAHDLVYLKKFGIRQVKWKLKEKGIPDAIIDETIEELDFEYTVSENLQSIMTKKLGKNYDIKNIAKVKRYLASRGYSFDEINSAFSKIKAEDEEYEG
ncbi:MAG: RecX family transcriptional regulator, partial [Clostridia bacterium]|nr:RecX family transcriptional regulator [Clostridia bacterium]